MTYPLIESNDEYRAVREAVGLLDHSGRGMLALRGPDRFRWLQGMVSQDVRRLEQGEPAVQACLLDATGHLKAVTTLINRNDELLLNLPPGLSEPIRLWLDSYLITEEVEIADRSEEIACLSVQGPLATGELIKPFAGGEAVIVPANHTGEGGFDLYLPASGAAELRRRLGQAGAHLVSEATEEVLRIEAGIPKWGAELDESVLPLEAGLEASHISYAKGCYIGQEIVARIQSRGHTNRALAGLRVEGETLLRPGDSLFAPEPDSHREVGRITSVTFSPASVCPIALGYVRHEFRAPNTVLTVLHEGSFIQAVVSPLPFTGRTE